MHIYTSNIYIVTFEIYYRLTTRRVKNVLDPHVKAGVYYEVMGWVILPENIFFSKQVKFQVFCGSCTVDI